MLGLEIRDERCCALPDVAFTVFQKIEQKSSGFANRGMNITFSKWMRAICDDHRQSPAQQTPGSFNGANFEFQASGFR